MKKVCLLLAFLCLLCSFEITAQGAYLEKGVNGFGSEARAIWSQDEFQGVSIVSGYSIAGILDIGVDLGYTLGKLEEADTRDLRIAFDYRVNVLKQTMGVPVSLQITGSYGLVNVSSDYLDDNGWIRRGTGYSIGVKLSRNIKLTSLWFVQAGLIADYESITYTNTEISNPENIVKREQIGELTFGGGLGFLFVFRRGATLALQGELRADQDMELQIQPIVAVAFPQR